MSKNLYSKKDETRITDVKKRKGAPDESFRTAWRRDYARLIHSAAFRRLQGKTQLFPSGESDYSRNRLTHSLEVAQIAKSIAIQLNNTHAFFKPKARNIDPDIVELAGLAHDLGHPPFGHNGEKALDKMMKPYGGFEGNAQTLHILARLEKKQTENWEETDIPSLVDSKGRDSRCGLNLCARTLAAILKYDNKIKGKRNSTAKLAKGSLLKHRQLRRMLV